VWNYVATSGDPTLADDNSTDTTPGLRSGSVLQTGNRVVFGGIAAIVAILGVAAAVLFARLPDANAFNARVERIFVENDNLTSNAEIKLLEILAQSGTAFSEVLQSYRFVIFILLVFATALLIAAVVFLMTIVSLNRRMSEIERAGIQVRSLLISREENAVWLNNMEFKLTEAAIETLSVLAEARMDDDVLSGAEIEAVISGRPASDCDEAAGATRIKRLRDMLGNQIVSELLVKNIARKGYMLAVDKNAIRMI
jgi:DNA-binding winged helix-turn-helix (wHTH) protein